MTTILIVNDDLSVNICVVTEEYARTSSIEQILKKHTYLGQKAFEVPKNFSIEHPTLTSYICADPVALKKGILKVSINKDQLVLDAHDTRRRVRQDILSKLDMNMLIPNEAETTEKKRQEIRELFAKHQEDIDNASSVTDAAKILELLSKRNYPLEVL